MLPKNKVATPIRFNAETIAAMSDAANGVNLSGPYATVDEAFEVLDEDWYMLD